EGHRGPGHLYATDSSPVSRGASPSAGHQADPHSGHRPADAVAGSGVGPGAIPGYGAAFGGAVEVADGDSGAPMESMRGLRREGGTGGDAELEPGQERRSNAGRQQEAVQKRDPGKEQRRESPQSGAKDLGKGLLEQDHRPAVTEQRSEQRRKPVGVTEGD